MCEETASFDLSSLDIATAIEETTRLAEKLAEMGASESHGEDMTDSPVGMFVCVRKKNNHDQDPYYMINLNKDGTVMFGPVPSSDKNECK